jgi:chromosome segregation ATPase
MFGGSMKPKLATEKVNVRKEKEKAITWIRDQAKNYDQAKLREELNLNMQSLVQQVKRDQKDIIADEGRQVGRLDKIQYLHDDLEHTKTAVTAQRDTMRDLKNKATEHFAEFDQARAQKLKLA